MFLPTHACLHLVRLIWTHINIQMWISDFAVLHSWHRNCEFEQQQQLTSAYKSRSAESVPLSCYVLASNEYFSVWLWGTNPHTCILWKPAVKRRGLLKIKLSHIWVASIHHKCVFCICDIIQMEFVFYFKAALQITWHQRGQYNSTDSFWSEKPWTWHCSSSNVLV